MSETAKKRRGAVTRRGVTRPLGPSRVRTRATPRQIELLTFLYRREIAGDSPPTVREMGAALGGIWPAAVDDQLRRLERNGYVRRDAPGTGKARTLLLHAVPVFGEDIDGSVLIVGFAPKGSD